MAPAIQLLLSTVVKRVLDKEKPLSKTNAATVGGAGFGGAAYMLIQTGEPNMVLAGYILGVIGTGLALYKEKKK